MPYAVQIALGMLVAALIIAGCVLVLRRTSGARSQRVTGSALIGGESTQDEHLRNVENLQTQNQVDILRKNSSFGP
jgi:hypothetical protein